MKSIATAGLVIISVFSLSGCFEETKSVDWWLAHPKETYKKFEECQKSGSDWICPYISRHLLSLNPLLACCRRYSRGER